VFYNKGKLVTSLHSLFPRYPLFEFSIALLIWNTKIFSTQKNLHLAYVWIWTKQSEIHPHCLQKEFLMVKQIRSRDMRNVAFSDIKSLTNIINFNGKVSFQLCYLFIGIFGNNQFYISKKVAVKNSHFGESHPWYMWWAWCFIEEWRSQSKAFCYYNVCGND
jgi:hypothetical protein